MQELLNYAREIGAKYPELKPEIQGLIDLCRDEIHEGSPEDHEIELCRESIRQLYE